MAGSHLDPRVVGLVACVLLFSGTFRQVSAATRSSDVDALNGLSAGWTASPALNWGSGDPCGVPWDGVACDSSNTVTSLTLDYRNLKGQISSSIGGLTGLTTLELSSNPSLTGTIPPQIGQLTQLGILSIQYCSLTGPLPAELGDLSHLHFLGLNANKITGPLPAALGKTNLTWLDVSTNQLSEAIPIASADNPIGLDNLSFIQHFHLNNNSFSGPIPGEFFSMPNILHVLLNYNNFSESLPNVANWSSTLAVIRVDFNNLTGTIPSGFANVPDLTELHLGYNHFSGAVPDFTNITSLNFLDLSANNFNSAAFPGWVLSLTNLTTLNLAGMHISDTILPGVFNLPAIQAIDLSSNQLNGSLTFEGRTGADLHTVNLRNNDIDGFSGQPNNPNTNGNLSISLQQNPICQNSFFSLPTSCSGEAQGTWIHPAVSSACSGRSLDSCDKNKSLNWYTCSCAYPLALNLLLTAPSYSNLDEVAVNLETDLASSKNLNLLRNQTFITNMVYESGAIIVATVWFFPVSGDRLPKDQSNNISLSLRHHAFNLPEGPYLVLDFSTSGKNKSKLSTGAIIGIAVGATVGFLIVVGSIIFAVVQKRRADQAVMNNPFASWGGGSAEFGEAPKLKGARWFSLAELKQYTNNWSDDNMIGAGGYGKVYRGELPNGDLVAIKRATEGSMQGANEFKNEIELLSRVHHRNLLGLVGFCYEGGEQALVYEFMSNGTLTEHLNGYNSEVPLSWESRREIALASAVGINYLHDHATPPIIHRDIKSANILLNEKMVAKVADFGLSKLAPDEGEKLVYSVNVKGTLGYLDPEYYMTQNLTDKSDVYSFGVVLLELLTAKPPIEQGRFVVREFRNALDRGGIEALRPLMDPALQDLSTEELEPFLKIALSCVEEDGASRPTTAEVVKQLQELDTPSGPKAPEVRAVDAEAGGGKKVKFADEFVNDSTDQEELLSIEMAPQASPEVSYPYNRAPDSFRYSGAYGVSATVKPK